MSQKDQLDASLTEGPVPALLARHSLPMLLGIFAFMSFNAVDTYFVAQLGVRELAAMSFTFPVVMTVTSLAIGLGAGVSSTVARAIGEGNKERARRLITDCMLFSVLISMVATVIGLLTVKPLFLRLGAEPDLIPLINEYMLPWYLGVVLMVVPMVGTSIVRAMGNSALAGKLMIAGAIFNVILDPLLIFGWWGFPRLELQGAAIASLVARAVAFVIVIVYIVKRRLAVNPLNRVSDVWQSWKAILHVGLPAMATNMIIPFASAIVLVMVAKYGESAVAGMGVAVRIEPVGLIFFYALSSIIGPFCGQNLGAQKYKRLLKALYVITIFSLICGVLLALLIRVISGPIVAAFTDSAAAMEVALAYLFIVPISYGLYGLVMCVNASFNGLGKPLPGTVISVLRVLGIYLPLALFFEKIWGISGLFIATTFSNLLVGLLAFFWLRLTIKKLSVTAKAKAKVESSLVAGEN